MLKNVRTFLQEKMTTSFVLVGGEAKKKTIQDLGNYFRFGGPSLNRLVSTAYSKSQASVFCMHHRNKEIKIR